MKEAKTAYKAGWERRFKGNAIGRCWEGAPPHTHTHAPSSASPVCLDTTEKLRPEVNIFVLLFSSAIYL